MSTQTVYAYFRVNDVLTDATTVKLSDATGTYGVKRDDTGAAVVADGTAMTKFATGSYSYSFTEPAYDLTYTAWVEIVYDGRTYRAEQDLTGTATPSVSSDSMAASYTELRRRIGHYLGYGMTPADWTTDQGTIVEDSLRSGLRRFYWPANQEGLPDHEWTFLRKDATLSLVSGTGDYNLPTDFGVLVGKPWIATSGGGRLEEVDSEYLLTMRRRSLSDEPKYCAVRARTPDATTGSRYEMLVYPTPDASYTLAYRYTCEPTDLDSTNLYPLGGVVHGETILEACLAAAEEFVNDNEGVHAKRFFDRLMASIRIDQEQRA